MKLSHCVLALFFYSLISCETQERKQERLAKQYCSSCHAFAEPELVDKRTWEKNVLPEMAFRMGLDFSRMRQIDMVDHAAILSFIPDQPMVSQEDWELIKQYYAKYAPDSLNNPKQVITDSITLFDVSPQRLAIKDAMAVTLIQTDTSKKRVYIGTRPGNVYTLNNQFAVVDSVQLSSAPSKMLIEQDKDPTLLLMGIMDPNEQHNGSLVSFDVKANTFSKLLDSLQRPVDFEKADLNNDKLNDYVICEFGNITGALTLHEGLPSGDFKEHVVQQVSGARKIIVKDFDGNGMNDILALMSQGDERIILLHNQGNFQFRLTTLLRFNPAYGSGYFETADFNNDGKFDILFTNGDNADYSEILKPYHGIRLFLNNGTNEFKESWFYPMHGASQTRTADFDNDGDLDIAAIAFFPDFKIQPEHGFVYFENTDAGFKPSYTPLAAKGRWITLEISDIDADNDIDIMLGSLAFPTLVPRNLSEKWKADQISVLLLRNKLK
jgi:hypothetical protein